MMPALVRTALAALLLVLLPITTVAVAATLKDVRKVIVSGDRTVPATVAKTAAARLKQAVRRTRRPVELPKVTMEVRLSKVVKGAGARTGRNSVRVEVQLSDLAGANVERERFTVNSFMKSGRAADRALAEAVVNRVAIAYRLATGKTPPTNWKRPGKGRTSAGVTRRLHTHQKGAAYQRPVAKEPVIIPSKAALTVRSRSRARSATAEARPTPCVVTLDHSCN